MQLISQNEAVTLQVTLLSQSSVIPQIIMPEYECLYCILTFDTERGLSVHTSRMHMNNRSTRKGESAVHVHVSGPMHAASTNFTHDVCRAIRPLPALRVPHL